MLLLNVEHTTQLALFRECVAQYPFQWSKAVSFATQNAVRVQNDILLHKSWSSQLAQILPRIGNHPVQDSNTENGDQCECGKVLSTLSAWKRHLSEAHGWRHPTF